MLKKLLVISTLTVLLSGCASTNTIESKTAIVGKVKDIEITDLRSKRVNDVMVAQATILNSSSSPQEVYYRCHFYDMNKFDVSGDVPWKPVLIYGGQSQNLECTSNSKSATDFKVELSSTGSAVEVYK